MTISLGWRPASLVLLGGLASCVSIGLVHQAPLLGAEWTLVALDSQPAGGGQGNRPGTLTLGIDAPRASGFAGCNRFAGNYALQPPALRFTDTVSTRMACAEGDALERRYLAALAATRHYKLDGKVLELLAEEGRVLARFER